MSAEPKILKAHGYQVKVALGGGAAAQVFKVCKPDDDTVFAAKVLRNSSGRQEPRQRFIREIEALKKVSHPNIVKVLECHCDDQSDEFFYVMEYVEGLKPLNTYVGSAAKESNPFLKNSSLSLEAYLMLLVLQR